MLSNLAKLSFWVGIAVLFGLTAYQSYYNHLDTVRQHERWDKMATIPEARPDAWTKTMDDGRTRELCRTIKHVADECDAIKGLLPLMPEICQ